MNGPACQGFFYVGVLVAGMSDAMVVSDAANTLSAVGAVNAAGAVGVVGTVGTSGVVC